MGRGAGGTARMYNMYVYVRTYVVYAGTRRERRAWVGATVTVMDRWGERRGREGRGGKAQQRSGRNGGSYKQLYTLRRRGRGEELSNHGPGI